MNYYEVLSVSPDTRQDDIKKAYQQLILKHHPDKNSEGSLDKFLKIDEGE